MTHKAALACIGSAFFAVSGCLVVGPDEPASFAPPPPPPSYAAAYFVPDAPRVFASPPPLRVAAPPAVEVSASSSFSGWPPANATDGNPTTSWYSGLGDSAARGRSPYFQVAFAEPASVHRVTVLGHRDPAFPDGYTIHAGRLELFDGDGRLLVSLQRMGAGRRRDFDFRFRGVEGVEAVRFTSIEDDGDKNPYGDVAIAEIRVE